MLLRNYDNIVMAQTLPKASGVGTVNVSTDTNTFGNGHINAKNYDGSICSIHSDTTIRPCSKFQNSGNFMANSSMTEGYNSLICGSDNTPTTYDDYKMGNVISGLTFVSHSVSTPIYDEGSETWISEYRKIFCNSNTEAVTVKEIGVMCFIHDAQNFGKNILLYRKVLDTPIEVPTGANFILSFTSKVYANPNKPSDYNATASV